MNIFTAVIKNRLFVTITIILALIIVGTLSSIFLIKGPAAKLTRVGEDQSRTGQLPPDTAKGRMTMATPEPGVAASSLDEKVAETPLYSSNESAPGTPVSIDSRLPAIGDKIVKTGLVTLKVKKRKFGQTFENIVMLAKANGGYVAGSNSASSDSNLVSGTLTVKIPNKNFEVVVARLQRLGKVTAVNINSQDVSGEYVDLESRLRHLRAQESILLSLMDKAQSISDSVTIQQQLSEIQLQIEQLTGRLNYLKDQTEYSSLQITINEPGISPVIRDRWGFKTAVNQSAHAFVDTINGLILLIGYVSPLLLIAAPAAIIWANVRRRAAAA